MIGTEKQIQWALQIRQSIHDDVSRLLVEYPESKRAQMARDVILPMVDAVDDATWFINNRQFDITRFNKLSQGEPDLKQLQRLHPELIK